MLVRDLLLVIFQIRFLGLILVNIREIERYLY